MCHCVGRRHVDYVTSAYVTNSTWTHLTAHDNISSIINTDGHNLTATEIDIYRLNRIYLRFLKRHFHKRKINYYEIRYKINRGIADTKAPFTPSVSKRVNVSNQINVKKVSVHIERVASRRVAWRRVEIKGV